jgi:hypothetical protein
MRIRCGHTQRGYYNLHRGKSLEDLAGVAAQRGDFERAARLWGAAEALRETIGAPLPPNLARTQAGG